MSSSTFYRYLCQRERKLASALLPRVPSPTGNYKPSTYERVSGYVVLMHAEFETYLEEIAKAIVIQAKHRWDTEGSTSKVLLALIAYYADTSHNIPERTNDQNVRYDVNKRIDDAFASYNKYIRAQNNGIKEKNVLTLFLPLGIAIDNINNALLIALDSFGERRGYIAHHTRAQQNQSPEDARDAVNNIIELLAEFDSMLITQCNFIDAG